MTLMSEDVHIHPKGTPKDNVGMPASKDMRATPKNYGKRKVVGVIRDGKYVDAVTGKPIKLSKKLLKDIKSREFKTIHINKIGGIE